MMKTFFTVMLLMLASTMQAQKTMYVPDEWKHFNSRDTLLYAENDPDNKYTWSKSRSVESDNVIVLWDKGYGSTLPSKAPSTYRVDEQDLLQKCEAFYDLEINKLGFVDPATTNLRKYKVMVLLNHTTEWVCYGGGYDFEVSALWLGPSACKPVGFSVAHEVGHSFHYMCYSDHSGNNHRSSSTDNTGFHLACGNGQAIWEQTAQWQASQSYPNEMFSQSIGVFRRSHNYAFSHEWHRYQSYWFHYFICQYYNDITTVGQVWRQPMTGQSSGNGTDFNQALMALKGLDAVGLYKLYYDYAAHLATWDIEACKPYRNAYVGDFDYRCVQTDDGAYQVALASTPQSTGFNVIPLKVPEAGQQVTTHFTALRATAKLADGDPAEMLNGETQWGKVNRTTYIRPASPSQRAFRLGYVALMNDGTRRYFNEDSLYCQRTTETTEEVTMTVPEGTSRLWLIVSPAPKRYVQHKWTEQADNAEHWPYKFRLEGTDLDSRATVYVSSTLDGREVADITLTYDIYMPRRSNYDATAVTIGGNALALLGTALQVDPTNIGSMLQTYSASGPSAGRIMFYALKPGTLDLANSGSTANGYGHWFNANGTVCDWGSGYVYSEFQSSSLTFNIGQYPNKCQNNQTYTIGQALRYKTKVGKEAVARFVFRVHIDSQKTDVELADINYQDPTGISEVRHESGQQPSAIFDLSGRRLQQKPTKGIYIHNGHKIVAP